MQQNKKNLTGVDDRIHSRPEKAESGNKIKCNSSKTMFSDSARRKTFGEKGLLWWNSFSLATVYLLLTSNAELQGRCSMFHNHHCAFAGLDILSRHCSGIVFIRLLSNSCPLSTWRIFALICRQILIKLCQAHVQPALSPFYPIFISSSRIHITDINYVL